MPARIESTTSQFFLRHLVHAGSYGFALAAGALALSISHDSASYWWLGWVTLIPLFIAIRGLQPGWASVAGAFWGISFYFFSGLSLESKIQHDWVSLLLLAAIPSVYASVGSAVTRRKGFHPILLGLGWAGLELAMKPLTLRYGLLAETQGNSLFLSAFGSVGGYVFVAFLVALANAWILKLLATVRLVVPAARMLRVPHCHEVLLPIMERILRSTRFLCPGRPRAPPVHNFLRLA